MSSLTLVLSGGVSNVNPDASLGGAPSPTPIETGDNNLFPDVTGDQVSTGYIDYKCMYLFNDDPTDDFNNCQIWIDSQSPKGAICDLGVKLANEQQKLTFVNAAGGTFALNVDGHNTAAIPFTWDPNLFAVNIQSGLRGLPNSRYVNVTVLDSKNYQVEWAGLEGNKKYPPMLVSDNSLLRDNPILPVGVTITETQAGTPINAIAPEIGNTTTPPTGVTFSRPTATTPITIGLLKPTDGFSIWIRRTTDTEAIATATDGMVFKMKGDRVIGGLDC